jgi:hypothetical protein
MSVSPAFTPPQSPDKEHSALIQQARLSHQLKRRCFQDTYFTYVLELQGGFFYVGRTLNIYQRLITHMFDWEDNGVEFIKLYGPVVRVVEIYSDCTKDEESHLTLLWMHRVGWERVRGGPWTKRFMKHKPRELDRSETCVSFHLPRSSNCKYLSRKSIDKIIETISSIQNETDMAS